MSQNVFVKSGRVTDILSGATATVTGNWMFKDAPNTGIQASVTGTGAVGATIVIEMSNDGVNPLSTPAGTITLSGTTSNADGFVTDAAWKFIRARITAISGTGATVNVSQCA